MTSYIPVVYQLSSKKCGILFSQALLGVTRKILFVKYR